MTGLLHSSLFPRSPLALPSFRSAPLAFASRTDKQQTNITLSHFRHPSTRQNTRPRRATNRTQSRTASTRLTLAQQRDAVRALPGCVTRAADRLVEAVALAQTARLLACRRQTAQLAVLVHSIAQPVHLRVAADRCVGHVNKDHFVELERGILTNPV